MLLDRRKTGRNIHEIVACFFLCHGALGLVAVSVGEGLQFVFCDASGSRAADWLRKSIKPLRC